MKQNTNLITLKLILLVILILLISIIWSESGATPDTVADQVTEIKEADSEKSWPEVVERVVENHSKKPKSKKYKALEKEHYYATKVFKYFKKRGFTNEAVAGIIGNMMIETSGGTLDLKPNVYSKSGNYYGLCQWSKKYYPEAHGLSFRQQLDYLFETMPWEFKTFGWLYKDGFTLSDFKKMTNVEEAAIAFTKVYERCSPASYELRKQAAIKAYNYFKALK